MSFFDYLNKAGGIVLDLFFPPVCAVCQKLLKKGDGKICISCRKDLPLIKDPYCLKCGKQLKKTEKQFCYDCGQRDHHYKCGRSVLRYEGAFRESVLRMKFHNRRDQIDSYAELMAARSVRFLDQIMPRCIIPVPMHKRKRRERGYDQCAILAKRLSSLVGIPAVTDAVVRTRYTRPQKGLDLSHRKKNLEQAFTVLHPERIQQPVVILDDIYTTGATIDELSLALRNAGIEEIYFLALCTGDND